MSDDVRGIVLSPVFPPRTVVAEPEHSSRLLPGASARLKSLPGLAGF